MAEVTYYFNSRSTANWLDPDYFIDNILTNYASTSSDGTWETLDGNTCPGTDLGTITKVEIRAYAYGDGNDQIYLVNVAFVLQTPSSSPGWTTYDDITGWPAVSTWAKLSTFWVKIEYNKAAKANIMRCAKVEIRVTYTPSAGYYHGLKVQGVGELALCDVGSNSLRIRKGGITYGIELVATDDPNASTIRVKTGVGIKAIRKYT